ncbi:glycosyltransferase [Membranicola marinus]|uniref:Glycosyltransferase n=1 Tax=Membranihabitans marinus TaxID=1227546 RepID=A0A953HPZ7_9BACT|nr:glycosyltransferase [Membranihabitans marinus]
MCGLYTDARTNRNFKPGLISIIAPCYNEEESIQRFLEEVSRVDYAPYRNEVIVVNDAVPIDPELYWMK